MKKKSHHVSFLLNTLFPLIFGVVAAAGFFNVGMWLKVSDATPVSIDYVFTFASERQRVDYSRELMNNFPGAFWVLSDYKHGQTRLLKRDGFDMSRISTIDTCSSTLSELDALSHWLRDHGKNSPAPLQIALVSSPYHMRRIKMMVRKVFRGTEIQFYYLPVPLDRYSWNNEMFQKWWQNRTVRNVVISEIQKILYYLFFFSIS